jgi:hypothetical protein
MKYNDNHVRDFEGAVGTCSVCGLEVTLDWADKPSMPIPKMWVVECPHCFTKIKCYKTGQENEV